MSLAVLLGGCLNAAGHKAPPPGAEELLQQIAQDEPKVRKLVAFGLAETPQLRGVLSGRPHLTSATIAGPQLHQDPITPYWAILYCVEAETTGFFSKFAMHVAVSKTPNGWRGSATKEKLGIVCTQPKRPFPELVTRANELADAQPPKP
ncbi:hypothetical protein ACWIGM_00690 [Bosea sp. NPDC055332]